MRSTLFGGLAAAVLAATGAAAQNMQTITVKGNAFYAGNERFYIRGVDYQPGGSSSEVDPLGDAEVCKRDVALFKDLGINAIRVYAVDNKVNHDECMQMLADAGIYLILDVNTAKIAINRADPDNSYNAVLLQHIFATIDAFKGYSNTMAFFAANEVIDDEKTTNAATVVKAVVRDMKEYIDKQCDRTIPVGYSAADVEVNREEQALYFNCGDDPMARIDFFAFNDYSWCGDSTFKESGWDKKVATYKDYSVPIFLSEYGCNEVKPRPFGEVEALYSEDMTGVYSGGLAYEFSMEENGYGLVDLKDGQEVANQDFDNLKAMFDKTPMPKGSGGARDSGSPSTCPETGSKWKASNSLPDMPEAARPYIDQGAGEPLGSDGPTNMELGPDAAAPGEPGQVVGGKVTGGGNGNKGDATDIRPSLFTVGLASWLATALFFAL